MATVSIDAGHGGMDSGAVYEGRQEKDDVLRLAMAVGDILEKNGINVSYVRTDDTYETPFKKAQDANASGADLFVSIHRNSGTTPNTYSGVQSLVYTDSGLRRQVSENINSNLAALGFKNLGIEERPNLVVLRRTNMPAVLLEVGFINNDEDNKLFDAKFNEIARGIADGIIESLYKDHLEGNAVNASQAEVQSQDGRIYDRGMTDIPDYSNDNNYMRERQNGMMSDNNYMQERQNGMMSDNNYMQERQNGMMTDNTSGNSGCNCGGKLYRVQVGAYRNRESADKLLNSLLIEGFPAFIIYDDGLFKIQVGAYEFLANAIAMEEKLRRHRYNTYITT